ncbi:MAG: helix-turn-helix transcriptional regulator [Lachnospiraceae bacterium]|nr:helix-turn-helix transcriptional regulator [Lachnospiraceae bacterium]
MISGLSEKLRALRLKYHYSQREVAERLNISPSIVSGYETGERTPSAENLLALSYLYKCSTDYLLGKTEKTPVTFLNTTGLSPEQIQALKNLIDTMQ